MVVLAHISDTHIDGGAASVRRLARTMAYLNDIPALDAVVVTGDVTAHGTDAEYAAARAALASPHLVVHCPGNHDDRGGYRRAFLGTDGDGPVNQVWEIPGALLVFCDSVVVGEPGGELGDATLLWLRAVLTGTAPGKPAVVGLHHPPVPLGSPIMDPIRLADADALAEVIADHPRVGAVLCGHAHSATAGTFAGRPLRVGPSVASTLALPWQNGPVMDPGAPVQVAFHALAADGELVSHYRVVPGADGKDTAIDG
jgi:3',5'-cyclic AMP phosphodiesterase CpdA